MREAAQVEPFGERLRRLARERGTSVERIGNAAYDPDVEGTSLAMLRKVMRGERAPNMALMEAIAEALQVAPTEFAEYQLAQARALFDERQLPLGEAVGNARSALRRPDIELQDADGRTLMAVEVKALDEGQARRFVDQIKRLSAELDLVVVTQPADDHLTGLGALAAAVSDDVTAALTGEAPATTERGSVGTGGPAGDRPATARAPSEGTRRSERRRAL